MDPGKLLQPAKEYDRDKDILLLVIRKTAGNHPVRGFAEYDGPLNAYKKHICCFKRRAALVIINPDEKHKERDVQQQAKIQLPEMILTAEKEKPLKEVSNMNAVVDGSSLWDTAILVQELFKKQ